MSKRKQKVNKGTLRRVLELIRPYAGLVVLTLVIVGGAVALWWFFSNDLGARPAAKSYGTALYDNTVESYLTKGTEKLPGVVGYLGFPGMEGRFVYAADTATAENAAGETAQTRFATASALNSTAPGNTVLASTDALLTPLTTEEGIKANSGFTLYLPGRTYRFKVLAVYYYDPAEQGDGAFDLYGSTDLSSYYDYLRFVAGIQARSLWDTEVEVGDASRFLTLTAPSEDAGVQLCVTGRLIEDGDHLMLDDSSTSLYLAKKLKEKKNLTVITNSVELVVELNGIDGWTIILTGGRLKPDSLALVGDQTQQMLRRYHVDTAVMSCKGIDLKAGVTDSSEFHAQTKQSMLRCAKKKILILDSSKIDKVSFIDIAPLDAFDIVVTNTAPSKPWLDFFADHNVECLYPGK